MNTVTLTGKILFEPEDKTRKHLNQASWKKVAMVMLAGEVCEYYAWFISKRYNLILNKPLRGAHISFINDSLKDLSQDGKLSDEEINTSWEVVKKKWNGSELSITLNLEPRTDDVIWWLNIPHDKREELQSIRAELGLGKPFFGMHMSIGYANSKNIEHSKYIHELIKNSL